LSILCVATLVCGVFGLLKISIGEKQVPNKELTTGSIQRSPAVRKPRISRSYGCFPGRARCGSIHGKVNEKHNGRSVAHSFAKTAAETSLEGSTLPACASISFEDSQHRAKRQDVAMASKGRGVEARGA